LELDLGRRLGETDAMKAFRRLEPPDSGGEAEDSGIRALEMGALLFRWVWLLWMAVLALASRAELTRPELAWSSISVAALWTVWLTLVRPQWDWTIRTVDLVICAGLIVISGLVVEDGGVVEGKPFFATGYPLSAALAWGATAGPKAGVVAGAVLGIAHLLTRPLNGVPLAELSAPQIQNVTGAMINYLVAGLAVGLVWRLLMRSSEAVKKATKALVKEREHSARLAERESLARAIHDSVLQALSLVHKRGRELASAPELQSKEVAQLAELAGKQEAELRALILRSLEDEPEGRASLRDALEKMSREVDGLEVEVSALGPLWLERSKTEELAAAVRQALENVARHARVPNATVFADMEGGYLVVTVRDQGVGFDFNERDLQSRGKVGILKSMKGRVEELGGRMTIATQPGRGTEVEFRLRTGGAE
jgi:signal transduction histidine kinase